MILELPCSVSFKVWWDSSFAFILVAFDIKNELYTTTMMMMMTNVLLHVSLISKS